MTLIPLAAIALAVLALAGYFRLRRRGLVKATRSSWALASLALGTAIALAVPAPSIALALALPQFVIVWAWSSRVMPARVHHRAWIILAILLIAVQALELAAG